MWPWPGADRTDRQNPKKYVKYAPQALKMNLRCYLFMKAFVKGLWQLFSFLFWPRWGGGAVELHREKDNKRTDTSSWCRGEE